MTQRMPWRSWTNKEDATIRARFPSDGPEVVASLFEGRTAGAVRRRAYDLGVARIKPAPAQLTEKTCTQCHAAKPLDGFPLAKKGLGGRAAWCKECNSAWFRANVSREEAARRVREHRERKRAAQVLETV